MTKTVIDHITITTPTLEAGASLVRNSLGVEPQLGGEHPKMGTHNLFVRLGDDLFLEVIAINPKAKAPNRPRWFELDEMAVDASPRLKTWVVGTNDISKSHSASTEQLGKIEPMSRGDTKWRITIPEDGSLALQSAAPSLIEWDLDTHPARSMLDQGLSLRKLSITHPCPEKLERLLDSLNFDGPVVIDAGESVKITAQIETPLGVRELSG